jgi:hypothetical protein
LAEDDERHISLKYLEMWQMWRELVYSKSLNVNEATAYRKITAQMSLK